MDISKRIAAIPLFAGLSAVQFQNLARIIVRRTYQKGELIFLEGDEGTGFYIVETGQIKVYKISAEGKEQILHLFGPHEAVGEVAVFSGQGFPASAKASTNTTCLFLPRTDFIEMVRRDPALALNMLGVMALRLRIFTAMIEDLSLKEVPGRLSAYLLFLSEKSPDPNCPVLEMTKGQLASLLGTIPETLSRILAKLGRMGVLKSQGSRISIIDRTALKQIADGERKVS